MVINNRYMNRLHCENHHLMKKNSYLLKFYIVFGNLYSLIIMRERKERKALKILTLQLKCLSKCD